MFFHSPSALARDSRCSTDVGSQMKHGASVFIEIESRVRLKIHETCLLELHVQTCNGKKESRGRFSTWLANTISPAGAECPRHDAKEERARGEWCRLYRRFYFTARCHHRARWGILSDRGTVRSRHIDLVFGRRPCRLSITFTAMLLLLKAPAGAHGNVAGSLSRPEWPAPHIAGSGAACDAIRSATTRRRGASGLK
jgi:hypothetical protein